MSEMRLVSLFSGLRSARQWQLRIVGPSNAAPLVQIAKFVNADRDEIVFTRGATEALNLIAYSWGMTNLGAHSHPIEVLLSHTSLHVSRRLGTDWQSDESSELGMMHPQNPALFSAWASTWWLSSCRCLSGGWEK